MSKHYLCSNKNRWYLVVMDTIERMEQQPKLRRRVRKPTQYGTCQVCGEVIALAVSVEPHIVVKHGYSALAHRHNPEPCHGSGQPPIEVSREFGESIARTYRNQLRELQAINHDVSIDASPPPGLNGAESLRARFAGETESIAVKRVQAAARLREKITDLEKDLRAVENVLITGSSRDVQRRRGSPTHRLQSMFRRTKDSRVYIVIEEDSNTMGTGKTTYRCRDVESGKVIRVTKNELTRALNDQGESKPVEYGMVLVAPAETAPAPEAVCG
jgi:hypothetical protein